MRLRLVAVFPLLYAAAFAAVAAALAGGPALGPFVAWQRILVRILAAAGCFAAVSCFERGDHLRRAWLWLGGGTLVILLRDVLRLLPPFQAGSAGPREQAVLSALGVLSNLALLVGIWRLAHSWRRAAIELPGGRAGVLAVALVTAVLAVLVAGPGALEGLRALRGGDWEALVMLVSAVVDIVTLCLIAPLLLTALALRGGSFAWPWGLIAASQLCWLFYDGAAAMGPSPGGFPLPDVFRGLAENFLCAAGLAQLLVLRQVRATWKVAAERAAA